MATVTVAKTYYDALVRRAELHNGGPSHLPLLANDLTISQAEYNQLAGQARAYDILRSALLRGGLNQETLDLLISEAQETDQEQGDEVPLTECSWDDHTFAYPQTHAVQTTEPSTDLDHNARVSTTVARNGALSVQSWRDRKSCTGEVNPADRDDEESSLQNGNATTGSLQSSAQGQRTLYFTGLPDGVTHSDLVKVIRGGRLLDLFVRHDRSAVVSFAEGAADFLAYAKKKDLYIHHKRIFVKWNDRQFRLPSHVANKIALGATRNIVIRHGKSKQLTTKTIRDDLEHIHNLVVISVSENNKNGDIFISTNSIHNALFARTCMMSRSMYKGLKIEWYPDVCADPIPELSAHSAATTNQAISHAVTNRTRSNPYALLDSDGENETELSSAISESQALPGYKDGTKIS